MGRPGVRRVYLFQRGKRLDFVVDLAPDKGLLTMAGLWGDLKDALPDYEVHLWASEERSPLGGVLIYDERLGTLKPVG